MQKIIFNFVLNFSFKVKKHQDVENLKSLQLNNSLDVENSHILFKIYCRFVASEESYAHPEYKRKLVEMDKTEYTDVFGRARWPGAPHRVLQTPCFSNWKNIPAHENEVNQPIIGRSIIHGIVRIGFAHNFDNINIYMHSL